MAVHGNPFGSLIKIMHTSRSLEFDQFAADVLDGLSSTPKALSSKYFYDDEGSRLFQKIMKLPEYYLTECEFEIFRGQADEIFRLFDVEGGFDLVELGAGDGTKTAVLIKHFLGQNADIAYSPIDISSEAVGELTAKFNAEFPFLKMSARQGDYFEVLQDLCDADDRRKVILFLGSNIGNFDHESSVAFFKEIHAAMNLNDRLFVGFDLQKDPHVIAAAYDDAAGVTARFNLNLLTRINRELGGNFDIAKFVHYANYRPVEGSARSFLMSRERQTVRIRSLDRDFDFEAWEAIFMEISQKYTNEMIERLAHESGFEIVENLYDSRNYYCDSFWAPK